MFISFSVLLYVVVPLLGVSEISCPSFRNISPGFTWLHKGKIWSNIYCRFIHQVHRVRRWQSCSDSVSFVMTYTVFFVVVELFKYKLCSKAWICDLLIAESILIVYSAKGISHRSRCAIVNVLIYVKNTIMVPALS